MTNTRSRNVYLITSHYRSRQKSKQNNTLYAFRIKHASQTDSNLNWTLHAAPSIDSYTFCF